MRVTTNMVRYCVKTFAGCCTVGGLSMAFSLFELYIEASGTVTRNIISSSSVTAWRRHEHTQQISHYRADQTRATTVFVV